MKLNRLYTKKDLLLLTGAAGFNFIVYFLGRYLSRNSFHHDLTTGFDRAVPFLPWTILIYWGCYLFWAVNYSIGVKYDKGNGLRFIMAHVIGEVVCFFAFVLYPTTMIRPEVTGSTVFDLLMKMTYQVDSADNLLPSIHCFVSWLCWIAVRRHDRIPGWYRYLSLIIALAVCISTLTVKQHVVADVVTGILLAEISYVITGLLHL